MMGDKLFSDSQDDSFNISPSEKRYWQYIESDLRDKDDFREQIEKKFLNSRVNQHYVFPRVNCSSDTSSEDNTRKAVPRNYKTVSTELHRRVHSPDAKSKRLKTEGNEKYDDNFGCSFHLRSESEPSEDVAILKCKHVLRL